MNQVEFEKVFKVTPPARAKVLAKVFGLFTEDLVKMWCECAQSDYENLGRPTIRLPGERRGSTLDFTFRRRRGGRVFVGELKCWPEYENHRHLKFTGPRNVAFLQNEGKQAWLRFLQVAHDPEGVEVFVLGRQVRISGSILVWCGVAAEGRRWAKRELGMTDVLSLEQMVNDLREWNPSGYSAYLRDRASWCRELFAGLSVQTARRV
jgi:hypothetical protein